MLVVSLRNSAETRAVNYVAIRVGFSGASADVEGNCHHPLPVEHSLAAATGEGGCSAVCSTGSTQGGSLIHSLLYRRLCMVLPRLLHRSI